MEPFGFVPRMIEFIQPACYLYASIVNRGDSRNISGKMYTGLFWFSLNIITFIYSDVKVVLQAHPSRRQWLIKTWGEISRYPSMLFVFLTNCVHESWLNWPGKLLQCLFLYTHLALPSFKSVHKIWCKSDQAALRREVIKNNKTQYLMIHVGYEGRDRCKK